MSEIKSFFDLNKDENGSKYACKFCSDMFSVQKTGTTSHLWTHMEKKHNAEYKTARQQKESKEKAEKERKRKSESVDDNSGKKQVSMTSFMKPRLSADNKSRYDAAVLRWIVDDGRPFEASAGPGFKNLCKVLTANSYEPPHPTTLSRRLTDYRQKSETEMKDLLKSVMEYGTKFSITFDHWKAENNANFMVVTLHFIEDKWDLKSPCLAVVNLEDKDADHTAATCDQIIREALDKYDIPIESIFFASTDTTNTMPATIRLLGCQWQPCAAHLLQLVIKSSLDVQPILHKVIASARKISGFFHSSTTGLHALHKYQKSEGLKESDPPNDVITRFNSTYTLLNWISKNNTAVSLALVECADNKRCARTPPSPLTNEMKGVLSVVLPVLKPIAEATGILSADQRVSISMIIPIIQTLKSTIQSLETPPILTFKRQVLGQIETRFDLEKEHLIAATILDPRFKTSLANRHQVETAKRYLMTFQQPTTASASDESVASCNNSPDREEKAEESLFEAIFNLPSTSVTADESEDSLENIFTLEFERYRNEPKAQPSDNPLLFWKRNEKVFPKLAGAAKIILSIQATNTSSERVNSVGSNTITDKRHNLSNANAETLIWARKNGQF